LPSAAGLVEGEVNMFCVHLCYCSGI